MEEERGEEEGATMGDEMTTCFIIDGEFEIDNSVVFVWCIGGLPLGWSVGIASEGSGAQGSGDFSYHQS